LTLPPPSELASRLDSVLQVIYLLFNEGYSARTGEDLVRHDLCSEALRLGQLLADRPDTGTPKAQALLALMYLQASRFATRVDDTGRFCSYPNKIARNGIAVSFTRAIGALLWPEPATN